MLNGVNCEVLLIMTSSWVLKDLPEPINPDSHLLGLIRIYLTHTAEVCNNISALFTIAKTILEQ